MSCTDNKTIGPSQELPILIGSYALCEYGIINNFGVCNDIDLVLDEKLAMMLAWNCDEKIGKMIFFNIPNNTNQKKTKVDLHLLTDESDKMIFTECNNNPKINALCKKISLDRIGTVLIPPLELLYVIIKSHIHRIIQVVSYQEQNINIWYEHVKKYTLIRDKLGYSKLDDILYKEYLGDWKDIDVDNNDNNDNNLENLMRRVYQTRFNETTKRVKDTIISLEKSEKDFFDDNVERFINHDDLHEEIGLVFRNDKTPIFKKYQTDPTKVALDKEVFLKADKGERIQMMREEIMVLFLERKWIPEIIKCYKEYKVPYIKYDKRSKEKELLEVGSNFITNLCGQGDYWIRRYCLDHSNFLIDSTSYDFDELEKIAIRLSGYENNFEIIEDDIFETITKYDGSNYKYVKFLCKRIDKMNMSSKSHEYRDNKGISIIFFDFTINSYNKEDKFSTVKFEGEFSSKEMGYLDYFKGINNIGINNNEYITLYNLMRNVGIKYCQYEKTFSLFVLTFCCEKNDIVETVESKWWDNTTHEYKRKKTDKLIVQGSYIDVTNNTAQDFQNKYARKHKTVYYYSKGCTEMTSPSERDIHFLSNYGWLPEYIQPITEMIARKYLRVSKYFNNLEDYDTDEQGGSSDYTDYDEKNKSDNSDNSD